MQAAALHDRLVDELEPVVNGMGLELEDVELKPAGGRTLVRVVVDTEGGVTLDQVAAATSAVTSALDDSGASRSLADGAGYTVEVTSPGVDRPLTAPRHWRRNQDRLVKVVRPDGRTVVGRVTSVSEDGAELDVDGSSEHIAYADIAKARVQVEFTRPGSER